MLDLVSNGRVEFGTGESSVAHGARGLRHRRRRTSAPCGRRPCAQIALMLSHEPVSGLRGQVLLDAAAQRRPEAGAEAAPADVAGLLAATDDPPGGAARPRRAHLRVRRRRGGEALGGGLLRHVQARVHADRAGGEPEHRDGDRLHVSRGRDEAIGAASRASSSSASRWRTTTSSARTSRDGRASGRRSRGTRCRCRVGAAGSARPRECATAMRASRRPASIRRSSSSRAAAIATAHLRGRSSCSRREVMPEFRERHDAQQRRKAERAGPVRRARARTPRRRRRTRRSCPWCAPTGAT